MDSFGKILIITGIFFIIIGGVFQAAQKIPWIGRLPGDIHIEGKSGSFYFPIVTCIILSIAISIILNLFGRR